MVDPFRDLVSILDDNDDGSDVGGDSNLDHDDDLQPRPTTTTTTTPPTPPPPCPGNGFRIELYLARNMVA